MREPDNRTDPAHHRKQFAEKVVRQLREAGYQALWAGGCVRDLVLQREPTDYDVATSAHPQQVRELFGFRRTLAVGAAFGVIIVRGASEEEGQIEVATFRNDAQYSDGRRPDSVTFSTAQEDAARRDFTINGMFYDPIDHQIIDYVGGQGDIERGLIRAIGDAHARIAEDKLRMLRAIRFAARFGFAIEANTEAAIARHSHELTVVSGERMTVELHKTLLTTGREYALRTWASTGLLRVLIPQLHQHWQRAGENACRLLRNLDSANWVSYLAAMLFPLMPIEIEDQNAAKTWLDALCQDFKERLKFSNDDLLHLKFALESQFALSRANSLPWSQLQPLLIHPAIRTAYDVLCSRVSCDEVDVSVRDRIDEFLKMPAERLNPPPLVSGQDLKEFGLIAGPRFKELLSAIRDAQLDGVINDRASALEWVKTQL